MASRTSGNGAQSLAIGQFGALLSENVKWQSFPAFPPEARLAVLVGEPAKAGPWTEAKLPRRNSGRPRRLSKGITP